jgi:hypothetical protein
MQRGKSSLRRKTLKLDHGPMSFHTVQYLGNGRAAEDAKDGGPF